MSTDPSTQDQRLYQLALRSRQQELLLVLRVVLETCDLLVGPSATRWSADVEKVRAAAQKLSAKVKELDGRLPESPRKFQHDLRTDLTVLKGFAEELAEYTLDQQITGDVQFVLDLIQKSIRPLIDALTDPIAHLEATTAAVERREGLRPSHPPAVERGRVLVVDDNPEIRSILLRELNRLGHESEEATGGEEALRIVRERATGESPFDLILLDVLMPPPDGLEILQKLKADPATRAIPVLMISGLTDPRVLADAIALGAEDYLEKLDDPEVIRTRVDKTIEQYRLRSRYYGLLHKVLPGAVVEEYVRDRAVAPKEFPSVAVLFADLKGFTPYSQRHTPRQVVDALEELFAEWDDIAQRHEVQKIKTIGDAFMGVAGALTTPPNPTLACVNCGLAFLDTAASRKFEFQVRVGISVGKVVAGLLGRRQFLYDLWGEAVNKAARMESHGDINHVNLSQEAYDLVERQFTGWAHKTEPVKGINGLTTIYRLSGPHPSGS